MDYSLKEGACRNHNSRGPVALAGLSNHSTRLTALNDQIFHAIFDKGEIPVISQL